MDGECFLKDLVVGSDIDKSKVCNSEAIIVEDIAIWPSYDASRTMIRFTGVNNYVEVSREHLTDVAGVNKGLINLQKSIIELLLTEPFNNYEIKNGSIEIIK